MSELSEYLRRAKMWRKRCGRLTAENLFVEATSVSTDRADQVSDHGSGTDPARVDGGEGLVNMRRRASKLGGTLTVISRPGGGASVLLKAPLRCVVTVSSH